MSISIYQASVPVFERSLKALDAMLDKAAAYAEVRKFDSAIYVTIRLRPDMLPFARQVQIACDNAKNASARIAGVEAPRFEDNEATLGELKARIEKTLAFIAGIAPKAFDGAAEREIVFPVGPNKMKMNGADYLLHYVTPNFYFHVTTAYDILRYSGVEVGKRDFLGQVLGISPA
jgi:hypothetical protein